MTHPIEKNLRPSFYSECSYPSLLKKKLKLKKFRQTLSYNQNINKNSSADWSVWNLRGKTIKTKEILNSHSLPKEPKAFLLDVMPNLPVVEASLAD